MKTDYELSCEVTSDLMVLYTTGHTSPETRQMVEAHLKACPICAQAFGWEPQIRGRLSLPKPVVHIQVDTFWGMARYVLLPVWGFVLFLLSRLVSIMAGLLHRFGVSTTTWKIRLYRARRKVAGMTMPSTNRDTEPSSL